MIIRQIVKIVNTPPTAIAIKTSIWLVSVKLKVKSGVIASRDEGRVIFHASHSPSENVYKKMNLSRQMTNIQPLTHILGPRNNWQWNQRGPVLGINGIFPLKNPLKMDFKGVRHQKITYWPHHQFSREK